MLARALMVGLVAGLVPARGHCDGDAPGAQLHIRPVDESSRPLCEATVLWYGELPVQRFEPCDFRFNGSYEGIPDPVRLTVSAPGYETRDFEYRPDNNRDSCDKPLDEWVTIELVPE